MWIQFSTAFALLVVESIAQTDLDAFLNESFKTTGLLNGPTKTTQTYVKNNLNALFERVFDGPATATTVAGPISSTTPEKFTCNGKCVYYFLCDGSSNANGADTEDTQNCPNILETCCEKNKVLDDPAPTKTISYFSCGFRNVGGLIYTIVGKTGTSEIGEFPWMMVVLRKIKMIGATLNVYECGGSLIAPNIVLTVAHCVAGKQMETLVVRGGEWDIQTTYEPYAHQDRQVSEGIIHAGFDKSSLANDVALLILEHPFDLAENIQTVCLPPKTTQFDDNNCYVSGWGKDKFGKEGRYQTVLQKIRLAIVPHDRCQEALSKTRLGAEFQLDHSFVCAGDSDQHTCRGDAGSPLVCPIPGAPSHYYQAGVVARGIACDDQTVPELYVNIPLFRDWIDQQLSLRHVEAKYYTFVQ